MKRRNFTGCIILAGVLLAIGTSMVLAWPTQMLLSGPPSQNATVNPPPGVQCDQGPNFVAGAIALPPQVATAGFNHCALNADWTTNSTNVSSDGKNINYSDPTTWISECGATTNAPFHQLWINNQPGQASAHHQYFCPPSNPVISDPNSSIFAGNVLQQQWTPSQFTNNGWTLLELSWPSGRYDPPNSAGGPSGHGLFPHSYYTRIVYRIDPVSFTGINSSANIILSSFWQDKCCFSSSDVYEVDFWDGMQWSSNNFDCQNGPSCRLHENGYAPSPGLANPIITSPFFNNSTAYHTLEFLNTVDGNTGNIGYCAWKDGVGYGCHGGGPVQSSTPENQAFGYQIKTWIAEDEGAGSGAGGLSQPFTMYIKQIAMFSCSTYWTSPCFTNPVITTQ